MALWSFSFTRWHKRQNESGKGSKGNLIKLWSCQRNSERFRLSFINFYFMTRKKMSIGFEVSSNLAGPNSGPKSDEFWVILNRVKISIRRKKIAAKTNFYETVWWRKMIWKIFFITISPKRENNRKASASTVPSIPEASQLRYKILSPNNQRI